MLAEFDFFLNANPDDLTVGRRFSRAFFVGIKLTSWQAVDKDSSHCNY